MDDTSKAIAAALNDSGELSIREEIDEGMNAYAYRAHQPSMGRDVFVKAFYYDANYADEILREPRLLVAATAGNEGRNLVRVYDGRVLQVGEDQYFCMTMEYVVGRSLLKELEARCVGQQEAVRISCGILAGLTRLHSGPNRVLHRDLKPANILLSTQGDAKITDFGSCALLGDGLTSVGASRHSPLYVPPEGWESPSRYEITSDIYQAGMVLYELINGPLNYEERHWISPYRARELKRIGVDLDSMDPFDRSCEIERGINWFASRAKLLAHGRQARPYFSSSLKRIVSRATKPAASGRFSSAAEFIRYLSQVCVPDWIAKDDGTYECQGFKGWNWRVAEVSLGTRQYIEVSKARPGGQGWRRHAAMRSETLQDAFGMVETA
jgi:serine/threonine protein kinase